MWTGIRSLAVRVGGERVIGQGMIVETAHHCRRDVMRVYGGGGGSKAGSETHNLFNQPVFSLPELVIALLSRVSFFK